MRAVRKKFGDQMKTFNEMSLKELLDYGTKVSNIYKIRAQKAADFFFNTMVDFHSDVVHDIKKDNKCNLLSLYENLRLQIKEVGPVITSTIKKNKPLKNLIQTLTEENFENFILAWQQMAAILPTRSEREWDQVIKACEQSEKSFHKESTNELFALIDGSEKPMEINNE